MRFAQSKLPSLSNIVVKESSFPVVQQLSHACPTLLPPPATPPSSPPRESEHITYSPSHPTPTISRVAESEGITPSRVAKFSSSLQLMRTSSLDLSPISKRLRAQVIRVQLHSPPAATAIVPFRLRVLNLLSRRFLIRLMMNRRLRQLCLRC